MQLFKVVPKEKVWEYNSAELPQRGRFWEYNSVELSQRKCFENTTPQSCLKGNVLRIQFSRIASKGSMGIQLRRVASKRNVLRIQFHRIASYEMFWENTTPWSCFKGNVLRIQFNKIASKEIFWEYNSVELPQRKCFENTIP